MKFKIDTAKMSYILTKVAKGVGKKYTQPVTECLDIRLDDGTLSISSTNGINFVTCIESGIDGESGECVVKAEQLIKLVEKTTKTDLSFNLKDTYLEVKGNGTYKVQIITEQFPTYEFNKDAPVVEVNTDVLKRVFKVNESAIAKQLVLPCLTGYNVGENCITTDGIKMCINDTKITEERVLITQALADLISSIMSADIVSVQKDGNKLLIRSENVTIFGTELDGLREYPNITGVLEYVYKSEVSMHKQELLSILDRLSLFVDEFDNNGIRITLDKDRIMIRDLKANNEEPMEYMNKDQSGDGFEVMLNIEYFRDVLSVVSEDVVTMKYDADLPIKIEDSKVTFFLGTM